MAGILSFSTRANGTLSISAVYSPINTANSNTHMACIHLNSEHSPTFNVHTHTSASHILWATDTRTQARSLPSHHEDGRSTATNIRSLYIFHCGNCCFWQRRICVEQMRTQYLAHISRTQSHQKKPPKRSRNKSHQARGLRRERASTVFRLRCCAYRFSLGVSCVFMFNSVLSFVRFASPLSSIMIITFVSCVCIWFRHQKKWSSDLSTVLEVLQFFSLRKNFTVVGPRAFEKCFSVRPSIFVSWQWNLFRVLPKISDNWVFRSQIIGNSKWKASLQSPACNAKLPTWNLPNCDGCQPSVKHVAQNYTIFHCKWTYYIQKPILLPSWRAEK